VTAPDVKAAVENLRGVVEDQIDAEACPAVRADIALVLAHASELEARAAKYEAALRRIGRGWCECTGDAIARAALAGETTEEGGGDG
jgi:hypothetical protein